MSDQPDRGVVSRRVVIWRRLGLLVFLVGLLGLVYESQRNLEPLYQATATIQMEIKPIEEASIVSAEALDRKDIETAQRLNSLAATTPNTALLRQVILDHDLLSSVPSAGLDARGQSVESLIRDLWSQVHVAVREGTHLIDISVEHRDSEGAINLANWIASEAIRQDAERKFAGTLSAYGILTNKAERLKVGLNQAESALNAFREKSGLVLTVDEAVSHLTGRLEVLRARQGEAHQSISQLERDRILVAKWGDRPTLDQLRSVPSLYKSKEVARIRELMNRHNDALELEGDDQEEQLARHTKIRIALQKQFDQALRDAHTNINVELERLKAEVPNYQRAIEKVEAELLVLADQQVEQNVLEREMVSRQFLYENVLERIKELDLTRGLIDFPLTIVQEAENSVDISGKNSRLKRVSLGCLMGAACVFLWDRLRPALGRSGVN